MKQLLAAVLMLIAIPAVWAGSDEVRSLRGNAALEESSGQPPDAEWQTASGKMVRSYPQQPPLIPHVIDNYAVTQKRNDCLMCHNWNSTVPGVTKVAVSHFVDRDGNSLSNISPRRYFCTQCHVPQKNLEPPVANTF